MSTPVIARGPGGGGGMGGGGGVIDPPPGLPFQDPPLTEDINPDPAVFETNFDAQRAMDNLNGINASLFTYNGLYPVPMIKVSKGQELRFHFTNSLPAIAGYKHTWISIES